MPPTPSFIEFLDQWAARNRAGRVVGGAWYNPHGMGTAIDVELTNTLDRELEQLLRRGRDMPVVDTQADWLLSADERETARSCRLPQDMYLNSVWEQDGRYSYYGWLAYGDQTARAIYYQAVEEYNQRLALPTTTREGELMPEQVAVIRVPHNDLTRTQIAEYSNLNSILMQGMDQQTWLDALRDIQTAVGDVEWEVERGGYRIDNFPGSTVRGVNVTILDVPRRVAEDFLREASSGRLVFREVDEDSLKIEPISGLEQRAWEAYGGTSYISRRSNSAGSLVNLRELRDVLSMYNMYMTTYRRRFIASQLRAQRTNDSSPKKKMTNWNESQQIKFEAFLEGLKAKLKPEPNSLLRLPILPKGTLSSRTWGIEVEAPSIEGVDTPEYWSLKGDGSLRTLTDAQMLSRSVDPTFTNPPLIDPIRADQLFMFSERAPDIRSSHEETCSWRRRDSITLSRLNCDCARHTDMLAYSDWETRRSDHNHIYRQRSSTTGEYNSPILKSYHSRGLRHLCDQLEHRLVNNSAGVHVHVGASDLTPRQAVAVTLIYSALEPLFEAEYKRGDVRTYCASVGADEMVKRFRKMQTATSTRDMEFTSRYWTVNLMSLQSHGTIEFRAMGPIYNYDHLIRWAYLCREIVNIAKVDVPQGEWSKVRTMEDFVVLLSRFGKETPTPEWAKPEVARSTFEDIVGKLGHETRRYPHPSTLIEDDINSPLVVNDDYNSRRTLMTGQRPLTTLIRARQLAGVYDGGDEEHYHEDDPYSYEDEDNDDDF